MQGTTTEAMIAILRTDGTVSQSERDRVATMLQGCLVGSGDVMQDRIIRRAEAARILGRSPKSVDRLAEVGILKKVTFDGYQRAAGFRLSDVNALVSSGKVG